MSNSTDDYNIDTDSSLEYFISLGNLCKLTPAALILLQPTATGSMCMLCMFVVVHFHNMSSGWGLYMVMCRFVQPYIVQKIRQA